MTLLVLDVRRGAEPLEHLAAGPEHRQGAAQVPAIHAVVPLEPVLRLEPAAGRDRAPHEVHVDVEIVPVNAPLPPPRFGFALREARVLGPLAVHVLHGPVGARDPHDLGERIGQVPEALLALAQLLLHLFSLRDVGDHAEEQPPAGRVAVERLARQDHVLAPLGVGEALLVLDRPAALEDEVVLGPEDVGFLLGEELVVGLPQELLARVTHEVAVAVVEDHPAMLLVLHEHRVGQPVEHAVEDVGCPLLGARGGLFEQQRVQLHGFRAGAARGQDHRPAGPGAAVLSAAVGFDEHRLANVGEALDPRMRAGRQRADDGALARGREELVRRREAEPARGDRVGQYELPVPRESHSCKRFVPLRHRFLTSVLLAHSRSVPSNSMPHLGRIG
jgi:hypothetical protein